LSKKTISIYSGSIPSTEFIERLIRGLSGSGEEMVLYGSLNGKIPEYPQSVRVYGNLSGWRGRVQAILRVVFLLIRSPQKLKVLRKELKCYPWQGASAFTLWKRHVPVLLHLPDVFHIQWAKGTEEWLYLKKCFGVRLVLSLRGAHINYSPLSNPDLAGSYRRSFPQLDAFHAVSKAIAMEALKYGANPDKIKVIYSGLPSLSEVISNSSINSYQEKKPFRLIAVGRFHWKKGYGYLLDALHLLRLKGMDVCITLIAAGKMPEEELYLIHELGLQDSVVHIKGLPFKQVQQVMLEHHALVLPSLEEGIANVVLEAMQLGLPVISTDCGGMSEAITHGENGWLVPVRDPEAIVQSVEELINMPESQRNRIAENAKQTIQEKFSSESAVEQFLNFYKFLRWNP
jgi:colanic acid/amylovoran biosynthesis glycosyltransferase